MKHADIEKSFDNGEHFGWRCSRCKTWRLLSMEFAHGPWDEDRECQAPRSEYDRT